MPVDPLSIGYLGPQGSHSHAAVLRLQSHSTFTQHRFEPAPYRSLKALIKALHTGETPYALLPAENSLGGAITETRDGLFLGDQPPHLLAECALPIQHALIQKQAKNTVQHVVSHPQALAQCRETLTERYGETLQLHAATSTSEAVASLANAPDNWAAIGTLASAKQQGFSILSENISDSPTNQTRFWLVQSPTASSLTSLSLLDTSCPEKTSLCLGLQDRPGALVDVLLVFKAYGITMTRIESRPARRQLGDYLFFIDVATNLHDAEHQRVKMYLEADSTFVQISTAYACLGVL